jgi:hypothetical protein
MIFDGWFRRYASLDLERFDFFQAASRADSTASLLHKFMRQHSGHEGLFGPKDGRCGSVKVRPIRPGPEHRQVRAQRHR